MPDSTNYRSSLIAQPIRIKLHPRPHITVAVPKP